jgi:SsrA-binding protein
MLIVKNKRAFFEHEILEKYTAGISLHGYEVKAIREGKANFSDSYVQILSGVPMVLNMYIGAYSKQSQRFNEADSRRSRKLLLKASEIEKIQRDLMEKGRTAIPLALILEHNMIKLEFGIAKGRRKEEKKHVEKERQIKIDLERAVKESFRS